MAGDGGQVLHTSENINQMLLLFRLRIFSKSIRLRTYPEKYLELVKKIWKVIHPLQICL